MRADEEIGQYTRPMTSGIPISGKCLAREEQGHARYGTHADAKFLQGCIEITNALEANRRFSIDHAIDKQRTFKRSLLELR